VEQVRFVCTTAGCILLVLGAREEKREFWSKPPGKKSGGWLVGDFVSATTHFWRQDRLAAKNAGVGEKAGVLAGKKITK